MSENENQNRFYEISNPSNPTFLKSLETNNKKEPEKKDNEENNNQEENSKIINEEKEVNISPKESIILKDEGTQKKEYSLNNSFEKKENISEEKKEDTNINNTEEKNMITNNELKEEKNEIVNLNNSEDKNLITNNEIKEEKKEESNLNNSEDKKFITNNEIKEEKKDEVNLNNSQDKNMITNNEIKEENNLNQNEITNNNITKMLNISNTDIMNLVKSQSYLTNLPLANNKTNNKNIDNDIKLIKLKKQDKKTYNNLKEKENSICLEINAIKQKKLNLENFSYDLIGAKNVVENNIITNELKKLKNNENNLLEKLQSVKQQIITLIDNEKKVDRKNNIKEYLERLNSLESNIDFGSKAKTLESEINKSRKKHNQDLEKAIQKKENELNKQIEAQKLLKENFIKEFREKEREIIHKRKMEVDEKMKEAKKFAKNPTNFDPKNYLYNRLANQFEENEKKFLDMQKIGKRKISGIEEISIVKRRIIENKYELEKRRIEKTNEMKQLWHSRSVAVAKYPSNILKQINEYDSKKVVEEEQQKMKKLVLSKERERYVKENISLPPICEKLKSEREKRQITFHIMEGKERVQCIKNEIDNKIKNKYSIVEESILKKLESKKASKEKKSKDNKIQNLAKSASDVNILKYKNIKPLNLLGRSLSPKKLKVRNPNEINYLEQLRKEKKIFTKNYVNWEKEIKNIKADKQRNMDSIKKQIEYLDEKYKMEKNLIKIKGGYLNNQELGNNINNMIINAIRGKLALIDNMNNNS